MAGPNQHKIQKTIAQMKQKFDMTEEGNLRDFLGINIQRRDDGSYHLTQPHLVDQLMEQLKFEDNTKGKGATNEVYQYTVSTSNIT